jgi:hypothetical protein
MALDQSYSNILEMGNQDGGLDPGSIVLVTGSSTGLCNIPYLIAEPNIFVSTERNRSAIIIIAINYYYY